MEALKYDYYKGPQYYRKCDHQSVQSVLVIKSKSKDMKNESDVFEVPVDRGAQREEPAHLRGTGPQELSTRAGARRGAVRVVPEGDEWRA